ncbi:hypothetical protein ACFFUB_11795 [Algimonas porphyrae]|uniref:Sel1 repeat family protein n=1 Tax=Algimonas porphyrae TaxID=1128113 RepID=A0ABQ5UVB1_9PROT|nr:hypothetical protein [Algimonas porphyrae]GLQ19093.1 hypothetical protein GCM10007854_00480 [Algimonas porphyrae]
MRRVGLILIAILLSGAAGDAWADPFSEIKTYVRSDHDRTVTECDRLATHPSDPEAVLTDGITREQMDKPAAIQACHTALLDDPNNPRLNYQLARAYGYSGLHEKGDIYRNRAVKAGYPQSLFVVGYIRIEGWDGRNPDPCYGGELVRRSAQAGRFAGLVGFPHYVQTGQFLDCDDYPVIDPVEIEAFLDAAEARASGYYQTILVRSLKAHFADVAE